MFQEPHNPSVASATPATSTVGPPATKGTNAAAVMKGNATLIRRSMTTGPSLATR